MRTISPKVLLAIYAVIPLAIVLMLADIFFWDGAMRGALPHFPEQLLWYTLIFNFPHIIASFFGFADKEYLKRYQKPLVRGIPLILALAFLLPWIDINLTVAIIIGYTMYHNVSQQTGIATMLMQHRDRLVVAWRFTLMAFALYLYLMVYPSVLSPIITLWGTAVLTLLALGTFVLTLLVVRRSKTVLGSWYTLGTSAIAGTGLFALILGYPIITITLLRIIHDITAFVFYIVHDENRNKTTMHNLIYKYILPNKKFFWFGIPLLGVTGTYILQGGGTSTTLSLFFIFAITHYYIEGFMWKHGSPHREHIAFA